MQKKIRTLLKAYARTKLDMPNPPDQSSSHGMNKPVRIKLEMPNPPDPSSRPWQEQAFKDKTRIAESPYTVPLYIS